jgi:hypothetical protein
LASAARVEVGEGTTTIASVRLREEGVSVLGKRQERKTAWLAQHSLKIVQRLGNQKEIDALRQAQRQTIVIRITDVFAQRRKPRHSGGIRRIGVFDDRERRSIQKSHDGVESIQAAIRRRFDIEQRSPGQHFKSEESDVIVVRKRATEDWIGRIESTKIIGEYIITGGETYSCERSGSGDRGEIYQGRGDSPTTIPKTTIRASLPIDLLRVRPERSHL